MDANLSVYVFEVWIHYCDIYAYGLGTISDGSGNISADGLFARVHWAYGA